MEKYLTNNEKIVYQAKIYWISNVIPVIYIFLCSIGIFLVYDAFTSAGDIFGLLWELAFGLLLCKLFFTGFFRLLGNLRTKICVTNKRIILQTGIFGTNIDDLLLSKSDSVSFSQSFLGRQLNFGEVAISTIGENGFSFTIDNPMKMRNAINQQIDNQRNINNVNMIFPTISNAEIHPDLRKLIDEQLLTINQNQ